MTETTDIKDSVPDAVRQFVLEWGNLGERWGVNRSVSQIHALLYASKQPLAAEDIADALGIARSNVSNSLRELQTWNLIRPVPATQGNAAEHVHQLLPGGRVVAFVFVGHSLDHSGGRIGFNEAG